MNGQPRRSARKRELQKAAAQQLLDDAKSAGVSVEKLLEMRRSEASRVGHAPIVGHISSFGAPQTTVSRTNTTGYSRSRIFANDP